MASQTLNDWATTISTDPWNEAGYAEWQDAALAKRRQWMEMMGLDAAEIELHCAPGTPADFDEELAEYNAMCRIQQANQGQSNS